MFSNSEFNEVISILDGMIATCNRYTETQRLITAKYENIRKYGALAPGHEYGVFATDGAEFNYCADVDTPTCGQCNAWRYE
jgi:hypothetical protein